jgi:hypothetical protein
MAKQELEQRISAALTDGRITSENVYALIEETTATIAEGEVGSAEEREKAFDPARSPDPRAARQKMEDALFLVGRLKTLLPRLETVACEVRKREQVAAYAAKRDALQAEADAIEEQLVQIYGECSERIVDAFERASAFQDRVRQELPAIPPGVAAFRKFDSSVARMLRDVVLAALDGRQTLWPQQSTGAFAAEFAQSMVVSHPGADWSHPNVLAQRRAEAEQVRRRQADYYQEQTKQQEERINREERERFGLRS